jgi:HEAT repeat protein
MAEEVEQKVRSLLRPTYDESGWYSAVKTLNPREALPVLLTVLEDEHEEQTSRELAALILGMLGDKEAIPALARTLHTSNRILRGRSAEALGKFELLEEDVLQQLIQGLQDEDYYFRECCAKALGQLKRPEALPALQHMSDADSYSSNREVAQKAIDGIQGSP